MTHAAGQEVLERAMSERDLQDAVVEYARTLGWLTYHTYDSRRSEKGFPDLVMVRRGRVIFAELKSQRGRLSLEQLHWWTTLEWPRDEQSIELYCWRPDDWLNGTIEAVLSGQRAGDVEAPDAE